MDFFSSAIYFFFAILLCNFSRVVRGLVWIVRVVNGFKLFFRFIVIFNISFFGLCFSCVVRL